MAANLAIVDDCILASMEHAGTIGPRSVTPRISSEKPLARGVHFACGYLSPYFITDPERMEVAFENAWIFLYEGKIGSRKDLLPLLAQVKNVGSPLLIIADDVGGEVLATLVVNKLRGLLQVAAVRVPGFGEQRARIFREIAQITGAKSIAEGNEMQLNSLQISDLGLARKITVCKNHTVVEGNANYCHLFLPAWSTKRASA